MAVLSLPLGPLARWALPWPQYTGEGADLQWAEAPQGPVAPVWDLAPGVLMPRSCTGPTELPLSAVGGDSGARAGAGSPCFPERLAALAHLLGHVPRQPGALLAGPETGALGPLGSRSLLDLMLPPVGVDPPSLSLLPLQASGVFQGWAEEDSQAAGPERL